MKLATTVRSLRRNPRIVWLGAGVAACCIAASPGASAKPAALRAAPVAPVAPARLRTADPHRERPLARTRFANAEPTPCAADSTAAPAPAYFVGIANVENVAGGAQSGILAGQENEDCGDSSGIVSGYQNIIGSVAGSEAAGSFIGGGQGNGVASNEGFVAAGSDNYVGPYGFNAGVGGGTLNTTTSANSFIGGGVENTITGDGSFIGGGGDGDPTMQSQNLVSGEDSFIGAGGRNVNAGNDAFLGAGLDNSIAATTSEAVVAGGRFDTASASYATVAGGYDNTASGEYSYVAGGDDNSAVGELTFAGGYHANATHNGSFVWSDYSTGSAVLKDASINQFVVRSSGGAYIYSNEAASSGVALTPGSGTWASLSDRNAKTDIAHIDDDSILAKVARLPVTAWRYRSERGARHVGPMAQDFYAAFGTGTDDRHITSIDEDGVALAAIKALDAKVTQLEAKIHAMERANAHRPSVQRARVRSHAL